MRFCSWIGSDYLNKGRGQSDCSLDNIDNITNWIEKGDQIIWQQLENNATVGFRGSLK